MKTYFRFGNPQKENAQGAVEFALILPILLLLLFGLIETGRVIFIYSAVTNAAREAARYGSATGVSNTGIPRYRDCASIIQAAVDVGFLGSVRPENVSITYDNGPGTPVIGTCPPNDASVVTGTRIVVEVTSPFDTLVPGLLPYQDLQIEAQSARTIIRSVSINVAQPPANAPTNTFTPLPTNTPTITLTPSSTFTPSRTSTFTPTLAQSWTPSRTPTITPTFTPTFTPTNTPVPTSTPQCSLSVVSFQEGRASSNSNFTFRFNLSQPPATYYLSTLAITLVNGQQLPLSSVTMNGNAISPESGQTLSTGRTIVYTTNFVPDGGMISGENTLFVSINSNLGTSGFIRQVDVELWNLNGIVQCNKISYAQPTPTPTFTPTRTLTPLPTNTPKK